MSKIGPKQTRAAHFLFPEQDTHTHELASVQQRKQKQSCHEGFANGEQAFSGNDFQGHLLRDTFSVSLKVHPNVYNAHCFRPLPQK